MPLRRSGAAGGAATAQTTAVSRRHGIAIGSHSIVESSLRHNRDSDRRCKVFPVKTPIRVELDWQETSQGKDKLKLVFSVDALE
jgi:hypothetical protein